MSKAPFFPRRLYRWYLIQQFIFSGFLSTLLSAIVWLWVENRSLPPAALGLGRETIFFGLVSSFVCIFVASIFVGRRLLIPLGRLIDKTNSLREFPLEDENARREQQLTFDEPGEWFELERAINRLGRDLRLKTIRLSREKTELRAIMSAVGEAVLAISIDKRILFYNQQFAYLFNVLGPDPDLRISTIIRSPDVLEAYDQALNSTKNVHPPDMVQSLAPARREVEITVQPDRFPRQFQLSVAPLVKKHNGEVYGAVGIFHDITELKAADRIRIEFVGNVSHELRTPLTTINGYLQTLVTDVSAGRLEQAQEFLGVVTQNVSRLKSLVEDLLDLSALESGKELKVTQVNVREITENVLKQVHSENHKIHLYYDFNEMSADPARLEQVLRNLMENAVRYVPAGKNIEIRWRQAGRSIFELSVKDDGPGIAPEHQNRLFERFYRVDESRSRAQGGTGIGLSLVKHIVQRHGGQVYVRSGVGRGAEFICEFPNQEEI